MENPKKEYSKRKLDDFIIFSEEKPDDEKDKNKKVCLDFLENEENNPDISVSTTITTTDTTTVTTDTKPAIVSSEFSSIEESKVNEKDTSLLSSFAGDNNENDLKKQENQNETENNETNEKIGETGEKENEKIQNENEENEDEQKGKIENDNISGSFSYIPLECFTPEMFSYCLTFPGKVYEAQDKASVIYSGIDIANFSQIFPNIKLTLNEPIFTFQLPWMRTPFGYSPRKNTNGTITNNLRLNVGFYQDQKEGEIFERAMLVFDEYLQKLMYENQNTWPIKAKSTRSRNAPPLPMGKKYTEEEIRNAYTPIIRRPTNVGFPDYISLKLHTDKDDATIAHVKIWKYSKKSSKNQPELITTSLTFDNAANNENASSVIIKKGDWIKCNVQFSRIFFSTAGNGATFVVTDIMISSESQNDNNSFFKSCPF